MSDFGDLTDKYVIKQENILKKLCKPLNDHLGIPFFGYYSIDKEGALVNLTNYVEQVDHFYSEKLYIKHPYLTHPYLFRTGYSLFPITNDPEFKKIIWNKFHIENVFLIMQRNEENVDAFMFAHPEFKINELEKYINYLDALNKFAAYFKREAKPLINRMRAENYNLIDVRGEDFYSLSPTLPLSYSDMTIPRFLKELTPLSEREQQCLALFKKGKSAQASAAILGLSQRTIESYFENIKNKLGVSSKWDLLNY